MSLLPIDRDILLAATIDGMRVKKCLLIANARKDRAVDYARQAQAWLQGRDGAEVIGLITDPSSDLSATEAEFVVVFGGDGTALNAVRRLGERPPPLLIVNLGRLGYLAETNPEEIENALACILANRQTISERVFLHGRILCEGEEVWHGHAVNEFVVAPSRVGRMIEVQIRVDGIAFSRFTGDGLIIASPTGSTAYALSAGGPIVNPEMRATILVPICPHQLGNRPLVMDGDEVIRIDHAMPDAAVISPDGQTVVSFEPGHILEVKASGRFFRLIQINQRGRYSTLCDKLGWSAEPTSKRR